jgi:hypothetical protein
MPKVLVCVFCFEEIAMEEKWLDVPGRMNEDHSRPEVRSRSI